MSGIGRAQSVERDAGGQSFESDAGGRGIEKDAGGERAGGRGIERDAGGERAGGRGSGIDAALAVGGTPSTAPLDLSNPPTSAPWETPARYWRALSEATASLDPPLAVIHADALRYNVHDMLRRAKGKTIRVASKSVRVRAVLDAVLAVPGYAGVLAYTLSEALWLAGDEPGRPGVDDVVVAYPSAERAALKRLASDPQLAARVSLMVDSPSQLDLVDAVCGGSGQREEIRVCLELDASWNGPLGHIGVWRSPVHTPDATRRLAETIVARPGFRLVGMMSYEAQIAGQGDNPANPAFAATVRWMQDRSKAELVERRALAVACVRDISDLEFVNGGGTGSLEFTSSDDSCTEIAAGSGLFGGHLFDNYRNFHPAPAAAFALSVVRRPKPATVTVLGGGWIASGPPGLDRLPRPVWPEGLTMSPREMAGEVQTPLSGQAADMLHIGDRVWFRHTKSGELSEHVNAFALVDSFSREDDGAGVRGAASAVGRTARPGLERTPPAPVEPTETGGSTVPARPKNTVTGMLPSYRGEGKVFL